MDSDGCISFNFRNESGPGNTTLTLRIIIASSDDVDRRGFFESLPKVTGFGTSCRHGDKLQYINWVVTSRRDIEMLVPRLLKHMCVKAKHLQRMFEKWKEVRGKPLTPEECEDLRMFSKESRYDSGPLKPKNHPSWAWTAGYLDGNGSFGLYRRSKGCYRVRVSASSHVGDIGALEFLKKAFGGTITSPGENFRVWTRNLGKRDSSFALRFLPKIVQHSRLKKHKIEMMINFHHQQRLTTMEPEG